ncbi:tyrosine-type recombinase/integrase [Natronobacterium texcoconense]|uniref:Site-specific recombinase XerD n=1 Tax=Natronobacterium texcoconense TaxID=1095778 RepID=A0A1H1G236_NATTX|nr:site-specific integrase [Natronobacterium texcoconense]SDR06916.1 Site-specific recombinase XerD [Natronobacterium texcoconense]
MTDLDGITVVTEPSREYLNQRQLMDYRSTREACLEWLLTFGKDPEQVEGYARTTVSARASRMDKFYRWVWDEEDRYVSDPSHEHADAFLKQLAYEDRSNADRSNYQKAVQMLFKWRHHEHGLDKYEPSVTFYSDDSASQPRDYLTREERSKIREASLEYGSIPAYNDLSPDQRDRWKAYLAQRFEKPKSAVSPEDWDRANGWKIPSLVSASLDAGLRPIEVERAKTYWVDVPNRVLRIPKDESSKNTENWVVSIQDRTAEMLERWLTERDHYEMYADTDALWLTRQANPYQTRALKHLLERLCEIADIEIEGRQMSWYCIRHSVGTYMAREEGLAAAQAQLRHKSEQTTMKYDQTPPEDRRDALDRMG